MAFFVHQMGEYCIFTANASILKHSVGRQLFLSILNYSYILKPRHYILMPVVLRTNCLFTLAQDYHI